MYETYVETFANFETFHQKVKLNPNTNNEQMTSLIPRSGKDLRQKE